jgi:hypothetical protein
MNDGANWQSQAILAYVRAYAYQIEDKLEYGEHKGVFNFFSTRVGRFENCREQGYVFSIQVGFHNERHYAVYEHRNCDNIIVLIAEGMNINTPSVDFMWKDKGENATKYDYDKAFSYGQIVECGEWIIKDMLSWVDNLAEKKKNEVEEEK